MTLHALKNSKLGNEVAVVRDGAEALGYLLEAGREPHALPELVLLNLELPEVDGLEVLRHLRNDERTKVLPVVVLSTEDSPGLLDYYGANGFIRKPVTSAKLVESARQLGLHWLVSDEASSAGKKP